MARNNAKCSSSKGISQHNAKFTFMIECNEAIVVTSFSELFVSLLNNDIQTILARSCAGISTNINRS